MKIVLDEYNITYLDLFDGSSNDGTSFDEILKVDEKLDNSTPPKMQYFADALHLNYDGYIRITPYIYEWMQTIPKYNG